MSQNSKFLNDIGLSNFDLGFLLVGMLILIVVMIAVIIILIVQMNKVSKLNKRLEKFVVGKDGKSLEKEITQLVVDNKTLKDEVSNDKKDIKKLFQNMELAYQKMGLVKYDAFHQMGGQLSFSLALLDKNDNGFILNSVHSTEGCYSYTKEIKRGLCSLDLGKEEEEALQIALGE